MWKKIDRSKNGQWELWHSFTYYIICNKYSREFIYSRNRIEAFQIFEKKNT